MKILTALTVSLVLGLAGFVGPIHAAEAGDYETILSAGKRSAADQQRDADRKPAEVLAFMGVEAGMTVLDVMAAGGWYTEIFSIVVGPEGRVYAENPYWLLEARDSASDKALTERLWDDRLINVERVDNGLADGAIDAESVDAAFTALNFHDTYYMVSPEAASAQMQQIHATLKPGGVLVVVDHRGDPSQDNASLHRIDQQIVEDIAVASGFTLEAEGDMLAHPEDPMTGMVFMPDIRGKTDRFVLKFRK